MIHQMRLIDDAFNKIKSGNKTIELRLYDEKRRKIKENDYIEFTNLDTNEIIKVKVIKLHVFKTFKELFDNLDNKCFGDNYMNYEIMYDFYTKEEEKEYGAVGIEIKLIKGDE